MKVSDYIVEFLFVQGIKQVFELVGGMTTHIVDSIHCHDKIKLVSMHHEQSAAFAADAVGRIEELLAKKRQIFSWYYERLGSVPGIKLIKEKEGCKSNYCYPSILLKDSVSANRDTILRKLKELNIHCRPGFPQMSHFPVFEQRFPNPVSKKVYERGISLASAANLVEEDIEFVCRSVIELIK